MKMYKGGGMLRAEDINPVDGMKVLIYKEAEVEEVSFEGRDGKTVEAVVWNVKVKLLDGAKRLAKITGISQDAILDAYGDDSREWIGHTLNVSISDNKYGKKIMYAPTSDPKDLTNCEVEKPLSEEEKAILQAAKDGETAGREAANAPLDPTNEPAF